MPSVETANPLGNVQRQRLAEPLIAGNLSHRRCALAAHDTRPVTRGLTTMDHPISAHTGHPITASAAGRPNTVVIGL